MSGIGAIEATAAQAASPKRPPAAKAIRGSFSHPVASFLIIFVVNRLQRWAQTRIPAH